MTGDSAGWLEQLLLRNDVEEVSFDGTTPLMVRLSDGRTVAGPANGANDVDLAALIRRLDAAPGTTS
jgi:hypothetical protein